ncbi:MAG: hypothetical protein ACFFFB_08800 [Candidatus Heimdallarchaeota archaeon]
MANKEKVGMWINEKCSLVHNPSIYRIIAMITMLLGIINYFPIALDF